MSSKLAVERAQTKTTELQVKSLEKDLEQKVQLCSYGVHLLECVAGVLYSCSYGVHLLECVAGVLYSCSYGVHLLECVVGVLSYGVHLLECVILVWNV